MASNSIPLPSMEKPTEVIIAGAGAIGLLVACELAIKDISVLILEQEAAPVTPWKNNLLGFRELFVPSVESFYRRGMLKKIFPKEDRPTDFPEKKGGFQFAGHFAGMVLNGNNIDYSRWKEFCLPGPACVPGATTLGHIENVLNERAQALGVRVVKGKGVTHFDDNGEMVRVYAGDECFEAQWLIGCDGGRSTVRKAAGIPFIGTEAEFTGYAVECELDNPSLLGRGFNRTPRGLYITAGPTHIYAVDHGTSFDRSQPVTREHFQSVLRRISGTDVTVNKIILASSFTDRSKQAAQYKKGRVLLAGDSAHIHPPFGAQGLNTGIGDAINLGWKLAATIKGYASPGLIDTYHQERFAVAAKVLEWVRAQIVTLRPDDHGRAIANITRELIGTESGSTFCIGRIWGLAQRYDLGDEHPLVGRSAPDFELDDKSRLGSKLETGCFMLVDFDGSNHSIAGPIQSMEPLVRYCRSNTKQNFGLKAMLVRPDGVVAWAPANEIDIDAVKTALARWINPSEIQHKFASSSQYSAAVSSVPTPLTIISNIGRSMGELSAHEPVKAATSTVSV